MRLLQSHFVVRLVLVLCLMLGLYLPVLRPELSARAQGGDPPPPAEDVQPPDRSVSDLPPEVPAEEVELQAALAALETAQQQGPAAVVALRATLRGKALDLAMADIVKAHAQLARQAPPRPETPPLSEAEEQALLEAQHIRDVTNRAQALADYVDPAESQATPANLEVPATQPNRPAADRTVGSSPCTYATIAAAITAANPGDRLRLEGGVTFTQNLQVNKSLTLQGGYNGCGSGSTASTTIDGGGSGRVFEIYGSVTVTLENLNITHGNEDWGGGLRVSQNANVYGTNLEIYNNTATVYGGGVRLWGARATFTNTNIRDNTAPLGAGVYGSLDDGIVPALSLLSHADVHDNDALTGDGFGGGVYMREGTVSIADCSDIYYNNAIAGGGTYLITSTLTIQGDCAEIMYNTATGNGGGIYAQGSTINLDQDAELYNNAAGTDGTGSGGGAYLDNSTLMGDKALIHYNTADDNGGGVYATNNSLLDMDLGNYACTGPRCSQLSYNTATTLYGGGVYASDSSEVDLRQVFVENNSANFGGGVYAVQSPVYLTNDVLARNNATGGTGDGLRLYTGSSLSGSSNTLAHNDASGATTGNAVSLSGATLSLINSVIWGHATSVNDATQTITCSDVQGGYTGVTNLNVDPLFISPADVNFHLQSVSPVIDRCASGPAIDADNDLRPVTYIRPATPYDMGADEAGARVGLNGAACAYGRIQDAIDAATSGATIQAASDVYSETVVINGKDLTIVGGYDVNCTTYLTGTTTVNGGGADSVFDITDSLLMLRNLDITGGNSSTGGGVWVWPGNSRVTLNNTSVFGNQASYGGGVYVNVGNVLTITNDSDVYNNTATTAGGGARVWGKFVGGDTQSDIYDNTAPNGGGVSVESGVLILNGSDLSGNDATGAAGRGGGIHVYNGGVVTLTGNVWIYGGHTAYDGAGIYADDATLYLNDFNISANTATHNGGGVYLAGGSRMDAELGSISTAGGGNHAVNGAGLYVDQSTLNFSGVIYHNTASGYGAGVYANASTLNLTGAQVGGVKPYQANQLSNSGYGAGLYLNDTHATLANTVVSSNTFPAASTISYGGGLHVRQNSVVTLTHSTVENHWAPSASNGFGAGLYIMDSVVTLDNSQVLSNTAEGLGGGVRLYGTSTLNIRNGSELRNNHANGPGGGIAATGAPDINISDSTLYSNTAGADGGAIYQDAGTLDLSGWWEVNNNTAGGNGGALAIGLTGDAGFYVDAATSSLSGNQAGTSGGALYVGNASTLELFADDGYVLNFSGNRANGGYGGGAFADGGALLNVYGLVSVTNNQAFGSGGAFYLSGGSRLWLDDHDNDKPQLLMNLAQEGGAITAVDGSRIECAGAIFGDDPQGNTATDGSGGAIYLSDSALVSDNCIFYNNQTTYHGGAIAAYTSLVTVHVTYPTHVLAPQALWATTCSPQSQECSRFYGNIADSDGDNNGNGGAIYSNDSVVNVGFTHMDRNRAHYGGAVYQAGSSAATQVVNTLVYSNTSNSGALHRGSGAFTVTNSTLANNLVGAGFAGAATAVSNTIAWGNAAGGFMIAPTTASCNIDQSGNAGVNADPHFVAPGAGENYHLTHGSLALDTCTTGEWIDLDNILRPAGVAYDMGAYEYAVAMTLAPDRSGSGLPLSTVVYTHTLTNLGATDTYTLTAQSSNGWSVTLLPPTPVTLNVGQAEIITATVNVPAGVLSGTVDTAVVTATSWTDPANSVAVTDTTLIDQTIGVALTPDRAGVAAPGSVIVYQHTLTNTGNSADVFDVTHASSQDWAVQVDTPLSLNAGQAETISITVTVPTTAILGTIETTVITATSRANAGQFASVTDTTLIDQTIGVALTPDRAGVAAPGSVIVYQHTLTNTGNSADVFDVTHASSQGWAVQVDTPLSLNAGQAATISITVTVPTTVISGTIETTVITATSRANAGQFASVTDTTTAIITTQNLYLPIILRN